MSKTQQEGMEHLYHTLEEMMVYAHRLFQCVMVVHQAASIRHVESQAQAEVTRQHIIIIIIYKAYHRKPKNKYLPQNFQTGYNQIVISLCLDTWVLVTDSWTYAILG